MRSAARASACPALIPAVTVLGTLLIFFVMSSAAARPQPVAPLGGGFEANRGQVDSRVKFVARRPGGTLFLAPAEMKMVVQPPSEPVPPGAAPRGGPHGEGSGAGRGADGVCGREPAASALRRGGDADEGQLPLWKGPAQMGDGRSDVCAGPLPGSV
jgi:hypothetical protein